MTKLIFSEMETSADYYLAAWDELEIEKDLFKKFEYGGHRFKDDEIVDAQQIALREIDRLKAAGNYETEREDIRKRRLPEPSKRKLKKIDPVFMAKLQTLIDGLQSTDPERRAVFEAIDKERDLRHKTPRENAAFIRILEPTFDTRTPGKGRPKISVPWEKVAWALDEMRVLMGQGLDIPSSSFQVATEEGGPSSLENRAKYFRKMFRERQKLRE